MESVIAQRKPFGTLVPEGGVRKIGTSGGCGQWTCKWRDGKLVYVESGLEENAAVTYHTDTSTFQAIVSGVQTPQEAFFEQRLAITGDLETALKLAVLFVQFLEENPIPQPHRTEVMDAAPFRS
jgi:predicted lipid carrier protein YhbT